MAGEDVYVVRSVPIAATTTASICRAAGRYSGDAASSDIEQQKSDGGLRQQELRLSADGGCLSLSCRREANLSLYNEEDGKRYTYWTTACPHCPLKSQCTTAPQRRITRWEHERVLEAVENSVSIRTRRWRAPRDGGHLRHAQDVDGRDALSNEAPAESRYRDGPARARLQSYARHQYYRCSAPATWR